MTAALARRLARLESAKPAVQRPVLVLLGAAGHDIETLVGIDGLEDHPRMDGEDFDDYLDRIEAHLRATRNRVGPLVTFAYFSADDKPDSPREPDADAEVQSQPTVARDCP